MWERKKKDQERFYNVELESLKREEAAQLNRFNSAQEEELKSIREYENMQRERVPIFSFPTHFFCHIENLFKVKLLFRANNIQNFNRFVFFNSVFS